MDMEKTKSWTFDKQYSKMIVGCGCILILMLHLWGNRAWKIDGNVCLPFWEYNDFSVMRLLGRYASICVSYFAFVTGYGMWIKKDDFLKIPNLLHRCIKFLVSYWIVMLFFFIIFCFTGDTYPDYGTIMLNLIGLKTGVACGYINVVFAWYVTFYIFLLIITPPLIILFNHTRRVMVDCLYAILLSVCISLYINTVGFPSLLSDISYNMYILYSVLLGILGAKYRLVDRLVGYLSTYIRIIVVFVVSIAIQISFDFFPSLRHFPYLEAMNTLLSISSVSAFLVLLSSTWLNRWLSIIGKYSMNIWFLHGIFFVQSCYFQKYAFFPKYSIFVLLWVILLMLPLSMAIAYTQKLVVSSIEKWIK